MKKSRKTYQVERILSLTEGWEKDASEKGGFASRRNPDFPWEEVLKGLTAQELEVVKSLLSSATSAAFTSGYQSALDSVRPYTNAGLCLERIETGTGRSYKPKAHDRFHRKYNVAHWTEALPKHLRPKGGRK